MAKEIQRGKCNDSLLRFVSDKEGWKRKEDYEEIDRENGNRFLLDVNIGWVFLVSVAYL